MKQFFKTNLTHFIAVAIFLLCSIIYCKPALEGKVLQQSDISQWKGMAQETLTAGAKYGQNPLWTNSMFGGMPTYQITGVPGFTYSIGLLDRIFTLNLPEPINLFFLACLCFYFLAIVLGISPMIGIVGALSYSFATYNPIIITVGHITKMHAIAYLPFFVGSIYLIFKKKYLLGGMLTGIATALFVQANHLQITYYGLIIVFFMTLFFVIQWIIKKEFSHILKTMATALIAGLLGLAVNAPILISTYEYGKESIRGGSILTTQGSNTTHSGLNKDYALSYSMFKTEPLVLMFPNIYGGGSDPSTFDPEKSKAIEALQQMQPQIAQQLQSFVQFYWGGIGFTAGPPYMGILICFFAFIGISYKSNQHKWWILPAIVFSLMLAAGSYFESFNFFMVDHLPFYNKFRAPSMIMVIPTLLLGIMALFGLQGVTEQNNFKDFFKNYKPSFIALGVLFASVLLFYINSDFKSLNDTQLLSQISQIPDQNQRNAFEAPARELTNALAQDRKGFVESDIIRAIIFLAFSFVFIFLYFKKTIQKTLLIAAIGIIVLIDLFQVNVKYLKPENYVDAVENENTFVASPTDIAIKKDPSNYRVLDMRGGIQNAFNGGALVAYHHNTVGGYNPAKLSIYQDLIENQWYKFPNCLPVVNMMNTKYVITGNIATDTLANPQALGNVWFVKGIAYKKGPAEVMSSLSNFNPKDTAIIEEKDKSNELNTIAYDSTASIRLLENKNDIVTYSCDATQKQFAVFSEIYYKLGWKAYIDEIESPIIKTNYVLRGLIIPAGKHHIRFEFKPSSIAIAQKAAAFASILLWGLLIGILFKTFKKESSISK
ncbi:MAG: YfhO family protein [Sediminibacterium sp.]